MPQTTIMYYCNEAACTKCLPSNTVGLTYVIVCFELLRIAITCHIAPLQSTLAHVKLVFFPYFIL